MLKEMQQILSAERLKKEELKIRLQEVVPKFYFLAFNSSSACACCIGQYEELFLYRLADLPSVNS